MMGGKGDSAFQTEQFAGVVLLGLDDSPAALALDAAHHAFAMGERCSGTPLCGVGAPAAGKDLAPIAKPTTAGIATLLGSPEGATIAWVHFLAFDLFIGRWIYLDSRERRLGAVLMAPILLFTLMLGPLGFLSYLVLRAVAMTREAGKGSTQLSTPGERSMKPTSTEAKLGLADGNSGKALLHRAWRTNGPLTGLGAGMILVFLATLE